MSASTDPIKITSPTLHATIWVTISVFAATVVMACIFKVEVVARGQGKIIPISRVQVVQPEFDGKITAIHIQNGSKVHQGDILVELETTDTAAEVNTITAEMTRLKIERSRIMALVSAIDEANIQTKTLSQKTLREFRQSPYKRHDFHLEQARLLSAEIDDLHASMSQSAARIVENDQSILVTRANIERIETAIEFQAERLEVAQGLLDRGSSSRSTFLDVQEAFSALGKEREIYLRELDQKHSQEIALHADLRSLITAQKNELFTRRSEIEARLATLGEQLRTAERRVDAAQLKAPMNGVVDQLEVFTIGAIARGGEQLLRVVPEEQGIEVEATFANNNIGFVEVGQHANIKLDAYPSERFGIVKGMVSDVAADSIESAEGVWVFEVRITPEENWLTNGTEQFSLRPGMTAVIDIRTEQRRLISYFFAPIFKTVQAALNER